MKFGTAMMAKLFSRENKLWSITLLFLLAFFGYISQGMATSPPTFSPANGLHDQPANITINGPTGATINYTLDGSVPTASSPIYISGNSVLISSTTQINAIATVSGVTSSVASAYYLLDGRFYTNDLPLPPTANLLGWFTGECYGPTISGAQSLWPDLSGAGNNATQTNSSNQPGLVLNDINGLNALAFNGSSSNFQVSSLTLSGGGLTLFAVINPTALASTGQVLNISGSPAPDNLVGLSVNTSGQVQFTVYNSSGTSPTSVTSSSSLTANQYHLLEVVQSGTTCTLYIDGVQVGQNTSMNQIPNATLNNNFMGMSSSSGGYFNGHIAELICYSTPLTTQQRVIMESYLLTMFQVSTQDE